MTELVLISTSENASSESAYPATERTPELFPGWVSVPPGNGSEDIHGLCAEYCLSPDKSSFSPAQSDCRRLLLWDTDIDPDSLASTFLMDDEQEYSLSRYKLLNNRVQLIDSHLDAPLLAEQDSGLALTANVTLQFQCHSLFAVSLGLIRLVQSSYFAKLADGSVIPLIEMEDNQPALLISDSDPEQILTHITQSQPANSSQAYTLSYDINRAIPATLSGQPVISVTVMELYDNYLMQQPQTSAAKETDLWLPVHPAISWGWSIRVERLSSGDWGIVRRKLMRPTVSHHGLQLPQWQQNVLHCKRGPES